MNHAKLIEAIAWTRFAKPAFSLASFTDLEPFGAVQFDLPGFFRIRSQDMRLQGAVLVHRTIPPFKHSIQTGAHSGFHLWPRSPRSLRVKRSIATRLFQNFIICRRFRLQCLKTESLKRRSGCKIEIIK